MEEMILVSRKREIIGKKVKSLRRDGWVPGIVYRKGEKSVPIQIKKRDLEKVLRTSMGENVVISLKIEHDRVSEKKTKSSEVKTVILREIQEDHLTDEILHVDFQEISLRERITLKVPISLIGEAIGVKRDGGILEHLLWELEIECLPTNIPEKIEVDINQLEVGKFIYVKDIKLPEGIRVMEEPEKPIVTISIPREEKVEEKVEEIVEPEVIKQKKPEGEIPEKEKK